MKRSLSMIVLLTLLVMLIISPFSALSLLMIFLLISAIGWAISTLVQTASSDDA